MSALGSGHGLQATLAGLSSTYGTVAPGVTLTNPRGLRRWHAALADARLGLASICCVGDSITYGTGGDGTSSGDEPTLFRSTAWPRQLGSMFAQTFDYAGEGWLYRYDGSWAGAGGAISHVSTGAYGGGMRATADTQTITVTVPRATDIIFWTWDGGTGTASYTVDGGSAETFSAGGGNTTAVTWTQHTIAGLADDTHTVVFTGPSSGNLYLSGVDARVSSTGVLVHRLGRPGWTTSNLVGLDVNNQGSAAGQTRVKEAFDLTIGADLYVVALGANDYGNQNNLAVTESTPGTTPTTYAEHLQEMVDLWVGRGKCVLLLSTGRTPNAPSPETYTQAEYVAAARGIAQATDHCAHLDIADVWGTAAQALAAGFLPVESTVHPGRRGHGSMAQIVHRALTMPLGENAAA